MRRRVWNLLWMLVGENKALSIAGNTQAFSLVGVLVLMPKSIPVRQCSLKWLISNTARLAE